MQEKRDQYDWLMQARRETAGWVPSRPPTFEDIQKIRAGLGAAVSAMFQHHARLTALEESMAMKPSSQAIATEVGDLSGRDTSSWTYSPAKEASGPDTTARTSIGDGPNSARTLGSRSEPIFTAEAWREIQTTLTKWVLRWAGGLAEPTPEPNGPSAGGLEVGGSETAGKLTATTDAGWLPAELRLRKSHE